MTLGIFPLPLVKENNIEGKVREDFLREVAVAEI